MQGKTHSINVVEFQASRFSMDKKIIVEICGKQICDYFFIKSIQIITSRCAL